MKTIRVDQALRLDMTLASVRKISRSAGMLDRFLLLIYIEILGGV